MNHSTEVMIVDDKPENLLALSALLKSPDYGVVEASSGEETVRYLLDESAAERCALVLLDVSMPGMDGYATADQLRSRKAGRQPPIIFFSAVYSEASHQRSGFAAGGLDYVPKPFDPDCLRMKVANHVSRFVNERAERRRQLRELWNERRLLHGLLTRAPMPAFATRGSNHRVAFVNPACRRLVGNRPVHGRSAQEVFPELRGQGLLESIDEVYRTGRRYTGHAVVTCFRPAPEAPPHPQLLDILIEPWVEGGQRAVGTLVLATENRRLRERKAA